MERTFSFVAQPWPKPAKWSGPDDDDDIPEQYTQFYLNLQHIIFVEEYVRRNLERDEVDERDALRDAPCG